MANIRGKSYQSTVFDVAEGYLSINPIFLKPLDTETIKELYNEILQAQGKIRAEKIKHGDTEAIRWRNMRLQRLHSTAMIIKNFARERKIKLF